MDDRMVLQVLFGGFVLVVFLFAFYYEIVNALADSRSVALYNEAINFAVHAFYGRRNGNEVDGHLVTAIGHADAALGKLAWLPFISGRTLVLHRLNAMPGTERLVREYIGREAIVWADQARADAAKKER